MKFQTNAELEKKRLPAPEGKEEQRFIDGKMRKCFSIKMPSITGELEEYLTVFPPNTDSNIAISIRRVV